MALFNKKAPEQTLLAPADGRLIPLESVPDEAFARKMLGDGFAVVPTGNDIFAPTDGSIETISEGGHAITMLTGDGLDLLIHVGIDTVSLGKSPFTVKVTAGQSVKAGDLLMKVDFDAIRAASLPTDIPVLVTNRELLKSLLTECGDCIGGQSIAATYLKN